MYIFIGTLSIFLFQIFTYCVAGKNILFMVFDDLRPALGAYKDPIAITPHIDKLAETSFLFTNAFAQQALCGPSRNSFLTSRRPDSLHLYDFYSYWRDSVGNFTTLPEYLKNKGYYTYSIGKIFHPGISSNFSDDQPYSWSQTPFHPKAMKLENSKSCLNQDGTLASNLICPVITEFQPFGTLPDIESTEEAIRFLQTKNQITDKPFFLAVGFHKPHVPFRFPESYLDFYPLENISLPSNRMRPALLPEVAWNPWIDIRKRDDIKKLNIPFPYGPMPDDVNKKIKQAYYASVSYVDHLIGEILQNVNLNKTIVILTADHGWSFGQHGEFSKYSNFKEATRVPLMIHVPNLSKKKIEIRALVELVDIFPTVVDLIGAEAPMVKCPLDESMNMCTEGQSLLEIMLKSIKNQPVKGKSAIFTQYPRPGVYPTMNPNSDEPHLSEIKIMGYSIMTPRYRYCEWIGFNSTTFEADWNNVYDKELYDHLIDPDENMNLADRPELKEIMEKLYRKLKLGWRYTT